MTVPISNVTATLSDANTIYNVMGFNVANIAANSSSSLLRFNVNGNTVFRIDLNGAVNSGSLTETIWVPAKAMVPSLTNGASADYYETPTSLIVLNTLRFSSVREDSAQFDVLMPKSWDRGPIKYKVACSPYDDPGTTTANTLWRLQAVAISNLDDISDPLMLANSYVKITGSDVSLMYISEESPKMTVDGSIQQGDWVTFKISRESANTIDNMDVASSLYGVHILLNAP